MKRVLTVCAALSLSFAPGARAQDIPAEYQQVLTALGKQGDFKDKVLKVNIPRNDLSVTVADEGPGIAAEHRERIFDRFFRLDEGRSRDDGGTGLGLAIAKWAVEVNGGQISVEDGANGGAVFRIVLPTHAPAVEARGHATHP